MPLPRARHAGVGVVLWLALLAGSAHANSYCAYDTDCEALGGAHAATVQDALSLAQSHPGPDTVEIGANPCPACKFAGGSYSSSDPLEIVGAGRSETTLSISSPVLSLGSSQSVRVSDLMIAIAAGPNQVGLQLAGARAERVDVTGDASVTGSRGVVLDGGGFNNGGVALEGSGDLAFDVIGDASSIADVDVTSESGILSEASTTTVQRGTFASRFAIVTSLGTTNVDDTLIDLRGAPDSDAGGLTVNNGNKEQQTLTMNARHVTIVGNGGAGQYGASATASVANQSAILNLRSSIIQGVGHSLRRTASDGAALLLTSYSNYDPAGVLDSNTSGGAGAITEQSPTNLDATFVDTAAADFELAPGSPLIDAGEPGSLAIGESIRDRDGDTRILDGNGDCVARRDVGAFEFVPTGLVASTTASPPAAHIGQSVTFDGSGSCDPEPGASLAFRWSFDDGSSASGAVIQHSFAAPGNHTATLAVTSSTGRSGTATRTVSITTPSDPAAARSTPPPQPEPFSRTRPRSLVLIPARPVTLSRRGVAAIALRCRGIRRCTGVLSLRTAQPVEGSARKRVLKLGSTRFSIPGNRTTRVNLRLSKARLALITKLKRVRVNAAVTDRDSAGRKRKTTRAIILKAPLETPPR